MNKEEKRIRKKVTELRDNGLLPLPISSAPDNTMKISLDNIVEIYVINNKVKIKYKDGTKLTIKGDVKIIKGLLNVNNSPIVDHCV